MQLNGNICLSIYRNKMPKSISDTAKTITNHEIK